MSQFWITAKEFRLVFGASKRKVMFMGNEGGLTDVGGKEIRLGGKSFSIFQCYGVSVGSRLVVIFRVFRKKFPQWSGHGFGRF